MTRTKGEVMLSRRSSTGVECVDYPHRHIASAGGYSDNTSDDGGLSENEANARFIVRCYNTANAIDELGLDGDVTIGPALVEFVSELKRVRSIDDQEQRIAERDIAVLAFWKAIKKGESGV